MRKLIAVSLLAMIAACAPAPREVPAPRPSAPPPPTVVTPPRPASSEWRDWPVTPGDWVYRQDARGSLALFGAPGGDALFTVRCDRAAGRLYLSRAGHVGADGAQMTLRTTNGTVQWPARNTAGTLPYVAAERSPQDVALDSIAFSRGRFTVEVPALSPLVIPNWPEMARVVEDCRS